MKTECDIIKDLLPLYAENMVSEKSKEMIEEHFRECKDCKEAYRDMTTGEPKTQFDKKPARSFRSFVRRKKWGLAWKVALITAAVVLLAVMLRLASIGGIMGFLALDSMLTKVEEDSDIAHYQDYMGANADEKYKDKWGMDESIFPGYISSEMDVIDYKMVYYNPWDAQYLSYLVVDYSDEDYDAEVARLATCQFDDYDGLYGVTGFNSGYELLAINTDSYYGFVYALGDGGNRIIYVEIIFCNYFMDLDYEEYIAKEYLPVGFDAGVDNAYEKKMMGE